MPADYPEEEWVKLYRDKQSGLRQAQYDALVSKVALEMASFGREVSMGNPNPSPQAWINAQRELNDFEKSNV